MNKIVNYIEKSQDVRVDRALADLLDSSELPFKLSAIRANSNVMAGNTLSRIMCKAAGEIRQMQNAAALERIRAPESTVAAEELITAAREAPQAEVELVTASVMAERLEAEGLADAIPDADAEGGVPKNEGVAEITSESIGAALSADAIGRSGLLDITNLGHLQAEEPVGGIVHPAQIRLLDGAQPGNLSGSRQSINIVETMRRMQDNPSMFDNPMISAAMNTRRDFSITTSDAVRAAIAECVAAEACGVPAPLIVSEPQTYRTSSEVPNIAAEPSTEEGVVPIARRRPKLCDDETVDGEALSDADMDLQEIGYIQAEEADPAGVQDSERSSTVPLDSRQTNGNTMHREM
jgi:hypothetical protein